MANANVSLFTAHVKLSYGREPENGHMETMGDRIKALRRSKGWSQQELANQLGVSREAVSQWETGDIKNIKLVTFLALIEILGTTHEILVHGPDYRRTGRLRTSRSATGSGSKA